ncbi:MAG: metallophosphoesterase [Bacteroidales bacterium]|nr:metallophosphoesterase [Bacteroidales bacterium]
MKYNQLNKIFIIIIIILMTSCEQIFEYSPYQVKVANDDKNQNSKNINKLIEKDNGEFSDFKIALIGDTHTFYDEFLDIVGVLNKRDDIDFIIHVGDITTSATNREFIWLSEILNKFNKPIITIIGNHDYLSNGQYVYEEMFGPTNFVFNYHNCKFVIFDDVIWEKDVEDPDFDWFNENLKNDNNFTHVIPLSHIPPWDEQFSYGNELIYNYILYTNNIKFSAHGHTHHFDTIRPYPQIGNIKYLTTDDIGDRHFVVLTIKKDDIIVENIAY